MKLKKEKQNKIIYLRKRNFFSQERFKVAMFSILIAYFIYCLFIRSEIGKKIMLFGESTIVLSLCLGAIIETIRQNKLIESGKLVMAKIDHHKSLSFWGYNKIQCNYYDKEESKLYICKGIYTIVLAGHNNPKSWFAMCAVDGEKYVPVMIDDNKKNNYFVLIRELIFSHYPNKPFYISKIIREVDLSQIEHGEDLSDEVNFQ